LEKQASQDLPASTKSELVRLVAMTDGPANLQCVGAACMKLSGYLSRRSGVREYLLDGDVFGVLAFSLIGGFWNMKTSRITNALRAASLAAGFLCVLAGLSGTVAATAGPTPEIDAGSMASALTLLSGGLLIITGRRKGK
jgi:hypothetical protein